MKNVLQRQLKRAIFMRYEEFKSLVNELCGDESCVDLDADGIDFAGSNGDSNSVIEALNEYYDISITSIHADDCVSDAGVWICYKEKKQKEIVKLEFRDPDWDEGVLQTYYLEEPDEEKLAELKNRVENRFENMQRDDVTDEELKAAEDFIDNIWTRIDEFINENFKVIKIDKKYTINY